MSNQTIDGVPRELIDRVTKPLTIHDDLTDRIKARGELRALLDAPAKPVEPVAYPTLSALLADLPEGYNKDDVAFGWNECVDNHRCSDAKPQGEPVAWQHRVTAGPQTGWSLWAPGRGREYAEHYTVEVRPLYVEQPAPVAVVLPDRPRADEEEYECMTDYEKGLLHGGIELWDKIDEVARLNSEKP